VDQERFDRLTVTLAHGATRRTLLQLLSGALVSAGLLAAPHADGKGKGKHKGKGKGKSPKANVAKRRRATAKDRRKQTKAAACPLCKRLNSQGRCVVDHRVNGQCCTRAGGQRGQCLNGTCWPGTCSGPICNDQTCPDGCCDAQGSCHIDDDSACGTGGGSCTSCTALGTTCGGGGIPGQCGGSTCTPRTCAAGNCGPLADGCGGLVQCGPCPTGQVCGGGTPSVCGSGTCTPRTCAAQGIQCGPAANGCGGTLDCGTCTAPQTCGGGGTPSVCGGSCTPGTPCGDPNANFICLDNGSCGAITCPAGVCPGGCFCAGPATAPRCYENQAATACATAPRCAPTTPPCPPGFACLACPDGTPRCILLCTG
jgi:hypothetical protein